MNQLFEARRRLDSALAQLEAGFIDEALVDVRRALVLAPDEPLARLLEARVQLARLQPRKALAALDAHDAASRSDRELDAKLLRVRALLQSGREEAGDALLDELVAAYPREARCRRLAAARALQRDDRTRAEQCLRALLECDPHDVTARRTLASLLAASDPQQAVELLQSQRGGADDHRAAARLLRQAGRAGDAEEAYSELLAAHPNDAAVWLEAGTLADEVGDDARAIARLQRAVELGGAGQRDALAALARAHMHAGRFACAGRCWWKLARRNGRDVEAWAGLVVASHAAGNRGVCAYAMRQLRPLCTRWDRRQQLARQWRHVAGATALREAATAEPIAAPLEALLQRAAATFEAHARRYGNRADTFYHLARCRASLDQPNAAADAAHQALRINPNYLAAQKLLQRAA